MTAPRRAFRLTLELQADTREALVQALQNMAFRVETDDVKRGTSGVSVSGSSSAIYELSSATDQTHESYFAHLREYLRAERQARDKAFDDAAIKRERFSS